MELEVEEAAEFGVGWVAKLVAGFAVELKVELVEEFVVEIVAGQAV